MTTEIIPRRFGMSALVLTLVCVAVMGREQQPNRDNLSDGDKAQIVESALRLAFGTRRSEFELPKDLSSENIEFVEPSRISGLGFKLLDARHMGNLKASPFVDYVVFRRLFSKDGGVLVVLSRVTERHPCFGGRDFSTERSFTYEFHKDSGEWIGQLVNRPVLQPSFSRTLFRKS
jgi:hypothetical protein